MKHQWSLALGAALLLSVGYVLAADDVELAGMKAKPPAAWKQEAPSNSMRLTQFKLPKADGDDTDAELAVFFLKGSGSLEDNLKRQTAKFKNGGEAKTDKIKVGTIEATYQDITGTFLSKFPPFDPNAKVTEKPDYRQLYVVFDKEGQYYLTLLGPKKTVEKHKKDFEDWLKNFK
jgi:hypothetical protein